MKALTAALWNRRSVVAAMPALAAACTNPSQMDSRTDIQPVAAAEFTPPGPFSDSVEQRMEHYRVPGVSVACMRNGQVQAPSCHGIRRAGSTAPISPQTLFQAASLSKAVTAIGALILVGQGKIALDQDLRPVFREGNLRFAKAVPPHPVTLRPLLSHTAGVNVPSFGGFAPGERLPTLEQIIEGAEGAGNLPVEISQPPGTYVYSGGGYELIELMIEQVAGQPFATFMQAHLFAPLGMDRTTFDPSPSTRLQSDLAEGHTWVGRPHETPWLRYPQHAAASLWSTPSDLCLLLQDLARAYGGGRGILQPRLARTVFSKQTEGMGLGFGIHGEGRDLIADHAGWNRGYRSYFAVFPQTGNAIAVMANSDRGHELGMELVRGAARDFGWPGYAPQQYTTVAIGTPALDAVAGTYRVAEADLNIEVARVGDHLLARPPRGTEYRFRAIGELRFIAEEDGELAVFGSQPEGRTLQLWGMHGVRL